MFSSLMVTRSILCLPIYLTLNNSHFSTWAILLGEPLPFGRVSVLLLVVNQALQQLDCVWLLVASLGTLSIPYRNYEVLFCWLWVLGHCTMVCVVFLFIMKTGRLSDRDLSSGRFIAMAVISKTCRSHLCANELDKLFIDTFIDTVVAKILSTLLF